MAGRTKPPVAVPPSWIASTALAVQKARDAAKVQESSASEYLQGFTFRGRTIQRILKGRGGQRLMFFTDGAVATVPRSTIHELAKLKGTLQYREKLLGAKTLKERAAIIGASRKRQMAILANHIEALHAGAAVSEPSVRAEIMKRIGWLQRQHFGSPILGETPATSAVPPHHGPAKTFSVIAETPVKFRTITVRGKRRVIPILE